MRVVKTLTKVAVFFECRFDTNLSITNNFGGFQKKFQKRFAEISFDGSTVEMLKQVDISDKQLVYLSVFNTGFKIPKITTDLNTCELSKEILEYSENVLGITEYKRVGLRFNFIIPVADLQYETVSFLERLISRNAMKQLGSSIGEIEVTFNTKTEDFSTRYNFRFVKRVSDDTELPEQGLMVDMDCSLENIDHAQALAMVNKAYTSVESKLKNFLNKFLQRGVK